MKVYLDGKFVDEGEATLSAFDAGVQHAIGLFETMRAYGGRVFRLDQHIDRLTRSARELGLTERLHAGPLQEAVEATLKENDLLDARLRLTLTGGNLSMLAAARPGGSGAGEGGGTGGGGHQPSILIAATTPTIYPESFFTDGVGLVIADPKANPFDPTAGHKTLNYWPRLQTLAAAARTGAGESLWFTITNHVASGAVSNVFLVRDGRLLTPIARGEEPTGAIASPVLPGVTRTAAIEAADRLGIPIERKMLTIDDVLGADEVFLTNTSWLLLPVVRVEKETIGDGRVGPVARKLYQQLTETIHAECVEPSGE